jgi:hypothetical protein
VVSSASPILVTDAASAFDVITVTALASGRAVVAPAAVRAELAPLPSARRFVPSESLADYGLDKPVASVDYVRHGVTAHHLLVGSTDFDAHDFYVDQPGDPAVYLVLSGNLRPALDLVGIVTPVPS